MEIKEAADIQSAAVAIPFATGSGGSSYGSKRGGRGGWSLLKLSMKKDMEYVVMLGSNNAAYAPWGGLVYTTNQNRGTYGGGGAFLYRQNRPIAIMGGGGGAGVSGESMG